jgi:hypothetical protein
MKITPTNRLHQAHGYSSSFGRRPPLLEVAVFCALALFSRPSTSSPPSDRAIAKPGTVGETVEGAPQATRCFDACSEVERRSEPDRALAFSKRRTCPIGRENSG